MTRWCRRKTNAGKEGGMVPKVDADGKLGLVSRRELLVWSVCGRPALTPLRDSRGVAGRRGNGGSECDRDQLPRSAFGSPQDRLVRQRPAFGCRVLGAGGGRCEMRREFVQCGPDGEGQSRGGKGGGEGGHSTFPPG